MLAHPHSTRRARRGSAIVESALVLSVFLMLLFGAFEYCRFLMVLHLTNNAARDGARYAAVNLTKPSSFDVTDYTDGSGNVYSSVTKYTTARMGGTQNNVQGFTVTVSACDPNGVVLGATSWNQITFPQRVGVTVSGTYKPITPLLLFMPSSIPINANAAVACEG